MVVFTGGPELRPGVMRFLMLLEEHTAIHILGVYSQSEGRGYAFVARDLWRRRKLLAVPLFLLHYTGKGFTHILRRKEMSRLRQTRSKLEDRLHFVPDIHADLVLNAVRDSSPDLGLIYGSPILKPSLFELPKWGTLGIHHGKMPEYRGKKTTFWALYNNEPAAGVTIQRVNAGLDTGQIVRQGEVAAINRSLRSVWRDVEALGHELYMGAILDVAGGLTSFGTGTAPRGALYRDPKAGDLLRYLFRRWRQVLRRPLGDASVQTHDDA